MRTGNAYLAVSISEVDEKRIAEIAALIDVFDDGKLVPPRPST